MYSISIQKNAPSDRRKTDILEILQDAGVDVTDISIDENKDWDKDDIIYALRKSGTNMSSLSEKNGYSRNSLRNALYRHYPQAEKIIADALDLEPKDIWPSRY